MELTPGTRLGTYEVLAAIGSGGMGEVYRARDVRLGRDVAIKILPRAFTADAERLARFEREARVLASLNHPRIAAIHDLVESGDVRGLVLELVVGDTLADRIARAGQRGLPIADAVAIARQVADALAAAHDRSIVHRDLKPANIKVTANGAVKVLDFGLAKAHGDEVLEDISSSPTVLPATRDGVIMGTAPYMSPEQARGQMVDKRSDIWSFGCVLYEMLTGTPAFSRPTTSDTIAAILEREPDWSRCPETMPAALRRLLRRCLEKDADKRLHDIADARLELDDALTGEPSVPAPARRGGARPLVPLAMAMAGVLAGLAVATGFKLAAPASPTVSLSRPLRVTNSSAQEFGPAISPDGKWVAYYANEGGRTDLWVRFLESGATTNLTASLNMTLPARTGIGGVAISPEGSQIAFIATTDPLVPNYDTWVIPAPVGGAPRKLLQMLNGMQWSPDGKQIVAVRPGSTNGDTLVVANSDGSQARDLVPAEPGRHVHWPAWSPDARFIYFIHSYDTWHVEPANIARVTVASGVVEPVLQSARRAIYPVPLPDGELIFAANPDSVDLGLWLKPPGTAPARPLSIGLGEYTEPRLSADGRKLAATLVTVRQALVSIPLDGGWAERRMLTDGYSGDLDPWLDARSDRLVFSSARSGQRNLWLGKADGRDAVPLTTEASIDERPAVSPDGQQVAFVSDRSGQRAIWLMSISGGAPRMLAVANVLDTLAWSPDGTRVIFARPEGNRTGLAAVSTVDSTVTAITTSGNACCPATSAAAGAIAYINPLSVPAQSPSGTATNRLWLRFISPDGKRLYEEMPDQHFPNGMLAWAPDGKRLVAASISANGLSSLWLVEPGAREPYRKLADLPATTRPRGMTWTADGSRVIVSAQEFAGDIVMFDVAR